VRNREEPAAENGAIARDYGNIGESRAITRSEIVRSVLVCLIDREPRGMKCSVHSNDADESAEGEPDSAKASDRDKPATVAHTSVSTEWVRTSFPAAAMTLHLRPVLIRNRSPCLALAMNFIAKIPALLYSRRH
jgi:hypothetical protein